MSQLNFTTYVAQIANLIVVNPADANYLAMIPNMVDFAEQREYRELDLIATSLTDATGSFNVNNRSLALSTSLGTFLVVEEVNVITPSTATSTSGSRTPLTNTSQQFIDITYPSNTSAQGVPEFWSMKDNATIIVGPSPNQAYPVEIVGTYRPASLSSGNSSTVLTQMLPDLFVADSMVFASGYMKNFGNMSDDPQSGTTWETIRNKLFASANVEEVRKKYQSQAWTSESPSPLAQRV
jgi:hypothetical protein